MSNKTAYEEKLELMVQSAISGQDHLRERAEKAERERDEVIAASQADWTRAWDNGHMVGCEETITKNMQQENAIRAKHWREAAEYLDGKVMIGPHILRKQADAIERGE